MKPAYYEYSQEYKFNRRYYDANDPEQMELLEEEIERQEQYEMEYADHRYRRMRDEGNG